MHEIFIVVDLEQRLGRVDHLPDHDRRDFDRIAIEIVDLELGRLEVARAQRHAGLRVERIGPARPGVAYRADVAAEELQHLAFVRRDGEETAEADEQGEGDQDGGHDDPHALALNAIDQPGRIGQQQHDQADQSGNAGRRGNGTFVHGDLSCG
jgi:hypothetical protein